jgi:GalNAc-alpha-(1->4)-GalNAc-alpha-(1->3)-diNAcBac-PP-undecaprenol alpha-1,4-N-acetyl-D-galactosaminyltransferase
MPEALDVTSNGPPHFMLVTGTLEAGGAERVMADMANYWVRRGQRVTLATWTGPEVQDFYDLHEGVERVWLDVPASANSLVYKAWVNMRRVFRLREVLKRCSPDAVLSFIDTSNVLTILASIGLRIRVVVSERVHAKYNMTTPKAWRELRSIFYGRADVVIAQTESAADWLAEHCRAQVRVIPNSVRESPRLMVAREKFILAVGRLARQKGFDLLLEAYSRIHSDYPDWRVVIIGTGPERAGLSQLCADLQLTDSVTFIEPVKDILPYMARAGLVVQPSRFEGFPNVLLEAMGTGAAVISADCPAGPAEIIVDGVNGRLVAVDDVAGLARTMAELMDRADVRAALGAEASKVTQRFQQDAVMAQWDGVMLPGKTR